MSELDADSYSDDPYTKECRLAKHFDLVAFEIFAFVSTFKGEKTSLEVSPKPCH